jgi:phenylacetate-CoA ligase
MLNATAEEIAFYQLHELKSMLDYAMNNSLFYRNSLGGINLALKARQIDNFKHVPIIYKKTIRENLDSMIASHFSGSRGLCFDFTGGSTGEPLKFAYDKAYKDFRWAMIYLNLFTCGYRFGDCHGFVYGSRYDSRKQYSARQRLQSFIMNSFNVNAFFLNDRELVRFVRRILQKKPKFIIGYASALLKVASYIKKMNLKVNLDFIESTSEYLSPQNRHFMEELFGCDVYDRYGCREVGNIAHECRFKDGLHVNWQSVYVEVINSGRYPLLGADYGDIVITSLKNKGMPFIRYYLGDIGRLDHSPCKCGLNSARLYLAGSREGDLLMNMQGGMVSSPALTLVYKDLEGIEQIQFLQHEKDSLTVRLVKGEAFSSIETEILKRLFKVFGKGMRVKIEPVKTIEREPSGKYRIAKRLFSLNEDTIGK